MSGRFLQDRIGYSGVSNDMGFVGNRLFVVRQTQYGAIDEWDPVRGLVPAVLNEHGLRPYITQLIPTPTDLLAFVDTPPPADGPRGFFRVDLSLAGQLDPIPGVPVGPGRWATVDSNDDNDILVTFTQNGETTVETFHVDFLHREGGENVKLGGVLGAGNLVPAGNDLYIYVRIAAQQPNGHQIGARYLLRVGDSPVVWERLRQPSGIDDDTQSRWITIGPRGRLYMMVTDRDGVRIYRRS